MTRPFQTKAFITRHFFILAFPFVLLLALWWPTLGASGGLLRSEHTGKFAVALVFLVQGLTLSRRQILAGALNPRFQVLTQGFIFVGFPLMGMLLMYVLGSFLTPELRDGFLILSVLPSTIASAAVLTAQAGGNVASALSASVCSNLLAIVLTPVWVRVLLGTESLALPLFPILRSLSLMILAPLLLGNALRLTRLRDFAESNAASLRLLNTSVILFIVLTAFSNAVQNDILQEQTPAAITIALLVSLLFFVISTGITRGLGGLFLRDPKDRLAICFSAPQKSMATGIPMIVVMIGDPTRVGALILPVLIYHQIQLLLGGFLASKLHHES